MTIVHFDHVDVIFGPDPASVFDMLDNGAGRDEIYTKTGNLVAVHDASLKVAEGEICVLMGLSGSGKSSLLRCVNGLNKVSRGHLTVRHGDKDLDLTACDRNMLYHLRTERISMVFQQFALLPWRSVRDNAGLGLELNGVPKDERNRIVDEKLKLVRLAKWADKLPGELSGGMRQRVGLARALATDAGILLMDEPFSALDPLIRLHLQDELIQLQEELKKTIIFVSHDLDEALKLGSIVAIMEAGRIVQIGTPEDIVYNPVNEYVRQFVASMNPLNVLLCGTLMRPVAAMQVQDGNERVKILDADSHCVCQLDSSLRPEKVTISGSSVSFVPFQDDLDLKSLPQNVVVTATPETPMRVAVEVNYATGLPMAIIDHDGCLTGVVSTAEILRGILREMAPTNVHD